MVGRKRERGSGLEDGTDGCRKVGMEGQNRGRWSEGLMNVKSKRRLMKRLKATRER